MTAILYITFLFTCWYGAACKSVVFGMVSAICLLSALISSILPYLRGFPRFLLGILPVLLAGGLAYGASLQSTAYLVEIAEYHYASIVSVIVLFLNLVALLPDKKTEHV